MPLFFFHLRRQDELEQDNDGVTLDTIDNAVTEAAVSLREIVAEELRAGRYCDIVEIEIADIVGNIIKTVTIDDVVLKPIKKISSNII